MTIIDPKSVYRQQPPWPVFFVNVYKYGNSVKYGRPHATRYAANNVERLDRPSYRIRVRCK